MLLEKMSSAEIVCAIETADGEQYDVVLDIGYDESAGFYYNSTYFRPNSIDRLRKSSFSVALQIELSALTDREYRSYMRYSEPEVAYYLETSDSVAV